MIDQFLTTSAQVPMPGDEGRVVPMQLFNYKLEAIIDKISNATSALYHVVMYLFTREST